MRQRELKSQRGSSLTQRRGLGLQVCASMGVWEGGRGQGQGRKGKGQDTHKLSSLFILVGETEAKGLPEQLAHGCRGQCLSPHCPAPTH